MEILEFIFSSALELVYPEYCSVCRRGRKEKPWCNTGPLVDGLRFWDMPHLCQECLQGLGGSPVSIHDIRQTETLLPVFAAARTEDTLVKLVGSWKYHGIRGLAWPLASLLSSSVIKHLEVAGENIALVPVPLHRKRRRARGFNQAEMLARLLVQGNKFKILPDILQRIRSTGQQAKVAGASKRRRNMQNAFRCLKQGQSTGSPRLFLVDDLVTSGSTVSAASEALEKAGWVVEGVLALGLAFAGSDANGEDQ